MFSDIQEHIPNLLHDAVRDPCSSQLHSENVIEYLALCNHYCIVCLYLPVQMGKLKKFSLQSEHLSPIMFSEIQEHIPDVLHDGDRDPSTSQLHAENVINILHFRRIPSKVKPKWQWNLFIF